MNREQIHEAVKRFCRTDDAANNLTDWIATEVRKAKKETLENILDNASGGGSWRRLIITELEELDKEN